MLHQGFGFHWGPSPLASWPGVRVILATWFDCLEKSFSFYEDIQFKMIYLQVKISCPNAENVIEASGFFYVILRRNNL